MTASLPLPKDLKRLIDEGFWPHDETSELNQNLHSLVTESVVRTFAPEESIVYFYRPPFAIVRQRMDSEKLFWTHPRTVIGEIDPDLTLLIGDFGLGSDAPIALDYRKSMEEPAVIRLCWGQRENHWVQIAPTFAIFAACLKG